MRISKVINGFKIDKTLQKSIIVMFPVLFCFILLSYYSILQIQCILNIYQLSDVFQLTTMQSVLKVMATILN